MQWSKLFAKVVLAVGSYDTHGVVLLYVFQQQGKWHPSRTAEGTLFPSKFSFDRASASNFTIGNAIYPPRPWSETAVTVFDGLHMYHNKILPCDWNHRAG